ncbi:protein of unknown function [Microbacterium sp. Nx66]|nr:protein of unknown function [Microbacterium sp. Nx66]
MPPRSLTGAVCDPSTPKNQPRCSTQAVRINGTRFDLPEDLQLDCHKRLVDDKGHARRTATGSYGRVRSGEPAPTMTTRCTTPACGAFIHPVQDRGISLREAAAFQTFPATYTWLGSYGSVERQIGNAVPVWMAESLGRSVLDLLNGNIRPQSPAIDARLAS